MLIFSIHSKIIIIKKKDWIPNVYSILSSLDNAIRYIEIYQLTILILNFYAKDNVGKISKVLWNEIELNSKERDGWCY